MSTNQNNDSYKEIILSLILSTNFWSIMSATAGIASVVLGGSIYFAFEGLSGLSLWVILVGSALIFLAILISPRAIAIFIVGRRGRYGVNAAALTIAFFVIVLVVNFIMYTNPTRIDVTATRVFSLSQQTIQVLDELDTEVMANAFFVSADTDNSVRQQAEDLLNEFSRKTPNFQYRFLDPELNRAQAIKYNVVSYPSIVFEDTKTGKVQGVINFTEQDFVTGILVSTDKQQKIIRILTGHGESEVNKNPTAESLKDTGFDLAISGLQRDNYQVQVLNLKQSNTIPEDTAALIIPGPKDDLDQNEYQTIKNYVDSGGRVLALFDPGTPKLFNNILNPYGITMGNELISDAVSNVAGEMLTPMLQSANGQYAKSEQTGIAIADKISVSFYPESTSIDLTIPLEDTPPHVKFTPLGLTTPASWLESNIDDLGYDENKMTGPFILFGILEANGSIEQSPLEVSGNPTTKIIIFGDSDFATNKYFHSSDNSDVFLNSVNWLADDYELVSIRPKLTSYRELVVNSSERNFIKWSSWVIPPTIMLIFAIIVWWRRR
ncbi:MAG: hypothetical protein FI688_05695 [SAR202 cluster bacterium]|nr:hypothetical protein [SAR202 cluster bacterium]|tara:strand:+ start:1617 stop:3266 length:1650 start_codon:yes stop_codon:yes gene_type:complete